MKTIKDISTRELVQALQNRRCYRGIIDPVSGVYNDDGYSDVIFQRLGPGGENDNVTVPMADIEAELSIRGHILNKPDGKLMRRLRAQTGLPPDKIRQQFGHLFFPKGRREVSKDEYVAREAATSKEYMKGHYVIK
jgi:hypothetical protein